MLLLLSNKYASFGGTAVLYLLFIYLFYLDLLQSPFGDFSRVVHNDIIKKKKWRIREHIVDTGYTIDTIPAIMGTRNIDTSSKVYVMRDPLGSI